MAQAKVRKMYKSNITQIWKEYEAGKQYVDKLGLLAKSNKAYRFYEGDHWAGLKSGDEQMPIIDIIKPVVDYKVSIVTQNLMQIYYSPMNYDSFESQVAMKKVCDLLNHHIATVWENESMDAVNTELVRDACIAGEKYLFMYFDPSDEIENGRLKDGKIIIETIDGPNIYFGNEQERKIQRQPYILITFRRLVKDIKEEAKVNGIPEDKIKTIVSDDDTDTSVGRYTSDEVENDEKKVFCVMKLYRKEDGLVYVQKSTKTTIYQEETCLNLKSYPVAGLVWNRIKGTCRGEGEVYKQIPNQIWVNKLEAYRLLSTKYFAFPKAVYSSRINNKADVDTVGAAIEVDDTDVSTALNSFAYIQPSAMSGDAAQVMNELITQTKEASGASDYALGQSDARSYSALMAIQDAASRPLSSQSELYKRYIEDVARIFYDFWCTYYPNGIQVVEEQQVQTPEGVQNIEMPTVIDTAQLEQLKVKIKVDITANGQYDKITEQQKRDNLLTAGFITFEEYVELLPEDENMKTSLMNVVRERQQMQMMQQQMAMLQQQNDQMQGALQQAASQYNDQSEQMQTQTESAYKEGQISQAINNMNEGMS